MNGICRVLVVLTTLAIGGASVSTPAGATDVSPRAVETSVHIKPFGAWTYNESTDSYTVPGTVRSPRAVCQRNRLVKVVGPTITLRDRANAAGKWSVALPVEHATGGTYKAVAVKHVIRRNGRTIVCSRAVDRYVLQEG